jgi:hypothetical protein
VSVTVVSVTVVKVAVGRVLLAAAPPTAPPTTLPGALGTVDQDPQEVREQACRIVSSNDRVCTPTTVRPPKPSDGGSVDVSWLSMLLWIVLVAAMIGLLVLVVRWLASGGWSRGRRHRERAESDDLDELELAAVAVDRSREPVNWRSEAEEHRREGRFREALRCRYRALVGDLARRGLIDEIPGRTTGEERAQLRVVRPVAGPPFDAAADLFDDAWYGHADVAADDDDRFQALERDVLAATASERR